VASATLFKQATLNHLAQAARSVLNNPQHIQNMLADLGEIDLHALQLQAALVSPCDDATIYRTMCEVHQNLEQLYSLEQWAHWMHNLVTAFAIAYPDAGDAAATAAAAAAAATTTQTTSSTSAMANGTVKVDPAAGDSSATAATAAPIVNNRVLARFYMRWSLYASLFVRHLTVRNALSFGAARW
jgi:hypothetical protein